MAAILSNHLGPDTYAVFLYGMWMQHPNLLSPAALPQVGQAGKPSGLIGSGSIGITWSLRVKMRRVGNAPSRASQRTQHEGRVTKRFRCDKISVCGIVLTLNVDRQALETSRVETEPVATMGFQSSQPQI